MCHVIESDAPRDYGKPTLFIGYVCFTTPRRKSHVFCLFQPAMSKKWTILSLDQRIEVMCRMGEAHHVEHLLPSHCVKTQMTRMISKQTGNAILAYVEYEFSLIVGLQYLSCYVALILVLLTIAYIIMTMRVLSMNTAGGDSSR